MSTPVLERVRQTIGVEPIFQQDNAPIHNAHLVSDWFISEGILTETWPPYSPDLNPIEHVWVRLKEKLRCSQI